jgi:hypothetical protein
VHIVIRPTVCCCAFVFIAQCNVNLVLTYQLVISMMFVTSIAKCMVFIDTRDICLMFADLLLVFVVSTNGLFAVLVDQQYFFSACRPTRFFQCLSTNWLFAFWLSTFSLLMKTKIKQWWSAISPISTKRTITFHLKLYSMKRTMTYGVGNPVHGLGKT